MSKTKKRISLSETNPTLAKEWNYDKNQPLTPSDITAGSNKKVWWKCSKGHEWMNDVISRVNGAGCPYCSNRRVLVGYNDLATTHPTLAKEWNYEKNKPITPNDVIAGARKKFWWKCSKGHEWQANLNDRSRGRDCPYCSNRRAISGENDFATTNPQLSKEWDYDKNAPLLPTQVLPHSNKKVWWKCSKGHEWQAIISSRTRGRGCPYCVGSQTSLPEQGIAYYLSRECTVYQRHKINGIEIDVYLPQYNIGIEYDGMYYHTDKTKDERKSKKLTDAGICLFRVKESTNNIIQDRTIYFKTDDMGKNYEWALKNLFLLLSERLDNTKIATIKIKIKSDRLKIREHWRLLQQENNLQITNPELVKEWNYEKNGLLKPNMFTAGSKENVWWKCSKGHVWNAAINHRSKGIGCPYCSGRNVISGVNDFKTKCPELMADWNYDRNKDITPEETSYSSGKKVWWKCSECGHEWMASLNNRSRGRGCPNCKKILLPKLISESKIKIGENDLLSCNFDFVEEWDYEKNLNMQPNNYTIGSGKKVWWKCKKGHEWEARINHRAYGHGCPYCTGQKAIIGVNDLATTHPDLVKQWAYEENSPLRPTDVSAGSGKKVFWRCDKGHLWESPINTRAKGDNCPYCSGHRVLEGFNDLYTTHPQLASEWDYEMNNPLTPQEVTAGSSKKVHWKCSKGHKWTALISNRSKGHGCPYCAGQKAIIGVNDLATTHPDLVKQWAYEENSPLKPTDVSAGSGKKVFWRCDKGHLWQSVIRDYIRGKKCPFCQMLII